MKNLKSVLFVDDDKVLVELFKPILDVYFEKVFVAFNGEDGFNAYLKVKPDIIITDYSMPKMYGLEMMKKIRETDKDIPFILTTGMSPDDELIKECKNLNGIDMLKPIDIDELIEIIQNTDKVGL